MEKLKAQAVAFAQSILVALIASREVKVLVITLLERYAARTDNDVDNLLVDLVRQKLLGKE